MKARSKTKARIPLSLISSISNILLLIFTASSLAQEGNNPKKLEPFKTAFKTSNGPFTIPLAINKRFKRALFLNVSSKEELVATKTKIRKKIIAKTAKEIRTHLITFPAFGFLDKNLK